MTRNANETKLCMAFTKHCEIYFPRTPGLLNWTHLPLEGRSPQEGSKLKKMGVNSGWYDYEFIWYPGDYPRIGFLEAKWDKNGLSPTQKNFDYCMRPMGVLLGEFRSVEEGHNKLISFGIKPTRECKIFIEPNTMTWNEKLQATHDFFAPRKDLV